MNDDEEKKINITGTNNRYMIKKLTKKTNNTEIKKRAECKNWNFSSDIYEIATQKKIINDISLNNFELCDNKRLGLTVFPITDFYKYYYYY